MTTQTMNRTLARLRRPRRVYLGRRGWNAGLVALIIVVGAWATQASPGFLSVNQLLSAAQASIVSAFLALGLTLVVVVGEIDISLTSIVGLVTVVIGLMASHGYPAVAIIIASLIAATALGTLNGLLVARFGMPSLAVTLGTSGAFQGAAYLLGGNKSFTTFPSSVVNLGNGYVGRIPVAVVIFAALAVLLAALLAFTTIGRSMYAVGRAPEAVRHNGASVTLTKVIAFAIGGFCTGIGALVFVGYYNSAGGSSASGTILFVVTAVALGGLDIYGGSGRISGVVLALILLVALQNGMSLVNVSTTVQTIVIGCLLILSLAVSQLAGSRVFLARLTRRSPTGQRPPANLSGAATQQSHSSVTQ